MSFYQRPGVRGWLSYHRGAILCGVLGFLLLGAGVFLGVRRGQFDAKCRSAGGYPADVNCTTSWVPMSCDDGCVVITPVENCDHVCIGAGAEHP